MKDRLGDKARVQHVLKAIEEIDITDIPVLKNQMEQIQTELQ
jgi:hypothetical protein